MRTITIFCFLLLVAVPETTHAAHSIDSLRPQQALQLSSQQDGPKHALASSDAPLLVATPLAEAAANSSQQWFGARAQGNENVTASEVARMVFNAFQNSHHSDISNKLGVEFTKQVLVSLHDTVDKYLKENPTIPEILSICLAKTFFSNNQTNSCDLPKILEAISSRVLQEPEIQQQLRRSIFDMKVRVGKSLSNIPVEFPTAHHAEHGIGSRPLAASSSLGVSNSVAVDEVLAVFLWSLLALMEFASQIIPQIQYDKPDDQWLRDVVPKWRVIRALFPTFDRWHAIFTKSAANFKEVGGTRRICSDFLPLIIQDASLEDDTLEAQALLQIKPRLLVDWISRVRLETKQPLVDPVLDQYKQLASHTTIPLTIPQKRKLYIMVIDAASLIDPDAAHAEFEALKTTISTLDAQELKTTRQKISEFVDNTIGEAQKDEFLYDKNTMDVFELMLKTYEGSVSPTEERQQLIKEVIEILEQMDGAHRAETVSKIAELKKHMAMPNVLGDEHEALKNELIELERLLPKTKARLREEIAKLEMEKQRLEMASALNEQKSKRNADELENMKNRQSTLNEHQEKIAAKKLEAEADKADLDEKMHHLQEVNDDVHDIETQKAEMDQSIKDEEEAATAEKAKADAEQQALLIDEQQLLLEKNTLQTVKNALDARKLERDALQTEFEYKLAELNGRQQTLLKEKTYDTYCPPESISFDDTFSLFTKTGPNDKRHKHDEQAWNRLELEKKSIFHYWESSGFPYSERSGLIFPNTCPSTAVQYSASVNGAAVLPKKDLEMCWKLMEAAIDHALPHEDPDDTWTIIRRIREPKPGAAPLDIGLELFYTVFLRYVMMSLFGICLTIVCFVASMKHLSLLFSAGTQQSILNTGQENSCNLVNLAKYIDCSGVQDVMSRGAGFCFRVCPEGSGLIRDNHIRNKILFCGDLGWTPSPADFGSNNDCDFAITGSRMMMAFVTPSNTPTPTPTASPTPTSLAMANERY